MPIGHAALGGDSARASRAEGNWFTSPHRPVRSWLQQVVATSLLVAVAVPGGQAAEVAPVPSPDTPAAATHGFIRGVGYSPWHSKPKQWIGPAHSEEFARDMTLMRELRINAIRTWGPMKRERLDRFREEGLRVLPQIGNVQTPHSRFASGDTAGIAFCTPEAKAAICRSGASLAQELANDSSLVGFLLGNEYAWTGSIQSGHEYAGFDEATIRAYHGWINRRFSSVEHWNQLTGRNDPSVDAIRPPRRVTPGNDYWEWWLFSRQAFADFLSSGREGIRQFDPKTPVSYALLCGNRWDSATEDAPLGFLDIQGDNLYWGWDRDWSGYGVRLCRRVGAGHPVLITELGFATHETGDADNSLEASGKPEGELEEPGRASRLMTQNLWFLALHPEVKGVFPFSFNDEWWHGKDPRRLDCVGDCFGLVTADRGHVKQIGRAVGACYAEFEKVDSFLAARQATVEVLVTDQVGDWWRSRDCQPNLTAVVRELYRHGVGFHLVSLLNPEDIDRSPCRRLLLVDNVIPDNPDQTSPAMDALRRFKAKGGEILCLAPKPLVSLYGSECSANELAMRIVPPPPADRLWPELESFLPARTTVVSSDRNIFWRVLTANGVPHLLVVVDGDQPATTIQVTGFVADGLAAGDAASFEKSGSGCVLTNVGTHALIRGH